MLIKIPDTNDLVTTTVLNTKISAVGNKIPNTSNLGTTAVLNTKLVKLRIKFPIILNILILKNLIT